MKFFLSLSFLLLVAIYCPAQKKADPATFAKTITAADLKARLNIIASAEMEGRNTPSPGLEKAADYITAQFKEYGLLPGNKGGYRQTYQLSKDSVVGMQLSIGGIKFTPYEDFTQGFSMPPKVDLRFNEYVFAGYGIVDEKQDDYKGADIKGKLVIFFEGQPDGYKSAQTGRQSPVSLLNKVKVATEKGAAAILIVRDRLPQYSIRRTGYRPVSSAETNAVVPVFNINANVVLQVSGQSVNTVKNAIGNELAIPMVSASEVVLKYNSESSMASASNVIGIVEGSDKKDEYVLVTAHYDHVGKDADGNIFYGADDDGSGTVAVMEMAEAFAKAKKAGKGPRRTMIFMTVSGEEKGLWGSEHYSNYPVFPLDKTSANLNIDMIGRVGNDYLNDPDAQRYVYVVGDDKLSTDLKPVTEKVNTQYTKLKLDRKFNDPNDSMRIYYRSDHYSFASKGVPAIFYFDGIHADYHKITDTPDKIGYELLAKRTQLVFYTAWEIANADAMMKRDLRLP